MNTDGCSVNESGWLDDDEPAANRDGMRSPADDSGCPRTGGEFTRPATLRGRTLSAALRERVERSDAAWNAAADAIYAAERRRMDRSAAEADALEALLTELSEDRAAKITELDDARTMLNTANQVNSALESRRAALTAETATLRYDLDTMISRCSRCEAARDTAQTEADAAGCIGFMLGAVLSAAVALVCVGMKVLS